MLDLSVVLSIDDAFPSPNAIPTCLGDRFLYANNFVFRRIRDAFRAFDFTYVTEADASSRNYFGAPLLALQDLVEQGVVPYRDNVEAVKRMIARNPAFRIAPESFVSQLTHNQLLHESAHLIAHTILTARSANVVPGSREAVLHALLCESFANVVERAAGGFIGRSNMHRMFLTLNSYIPWGSAHERSLSFLVTTYGLNNLLRIGLLAYLHTNMNDKAPTEDVARCWRDAIFGVNGLTPAEAELLDVSLRSMFVLTPQFRHATTSIFFRLMGNEEEYVKTCGMALNEQNLRSYDLLQKVTLLADSISDPASATLDTALIEHSTR